MLKIPVKNNAFSTKGVLLAKEEIIEATSRIESDT
jgi:hypothetical protein